MITIDTFRRGLKKGLHVLVELGKIMLPIYVVMELLEYSGILEIISMYFVPFMSIIGLPGEAAFALIIGGALNIYASLGVLGSITLTAKQATIAATFIAISHNLIGETVVIKRIGVNPVFIMVLRILTSFAVASVMNMVL
ncbi:Nucleoside recognition [Dethiosulfatibacter aminovorans DSM 17477]|uniref:Nucleoside recognition n=1 Tax=Dethiosulfatibacter aminovorans DSM 17477 TaxID=1121476 RepID=A0A1M6HZD5_9FIRM|nr:nucleoside recognition domain-containing protein [Dethiosulfatibacter aminovorans]SHJ27598.1 Nucleoside recognition [Dethiosulfatibacter aminovorans DSM 17477]